MDSCNTCGITNDTVIPFEESNVCISCLALILEETHSKSTTHTSSSTADLYDISNFDIEDDSAHSRTESSSISAASLEKTNTIKNWAFSEFGIRIRDFNFDSIDKTKLTKEDITDFTRKLDGDNESFIAGAFWTKTQLEKKQKYEQDRIIREEQNARYQQSLLKDQMKSMESSNTSTSISAPTASSSSSIEEVRNMRAKFFSKK
jgi:hypothetical protein